MSILDISGQKPSNARESAVTAADKQVALEKQTEQQNAVEKANTVKLRETGSESARINAESDRQSEFSRKELDEAVAKINDYVQSIKRTLSFSLDENRGQIVIDVYDAETKELIRRIPPEDVMDVSKGLESQLNGLLLKTKV